MKKKKNHSHKQTRLLKKRNELYIIKDQQKQLRHRERELKSEMMKAMHDTHILEDANGTIEKISRKSKRICDQDLLVAELKKRGFTDTEVEAIIEAGSRQVNVSKHLSVTPKHKEF